MFSPTKGKGGFGQITIDSNVANLARQDGLIHLNYKDDTRITGAAVSDKGLVAIKPLNNTNIVADTIHYKGDVLAVNKGKVELDFTPNIRLVGRLDNFSGLTDSKHKNLFENYVANLDSKSAGEINFNLAKDALWTMTGQSWLDKLKDKALSILIMMLKQVDAPYISVNWRVFVNS